MAHELEVKKNGEARMFYAGKAPWHGLGTAGEKEVTAAAALKLSDLEWEVEKQPRYLPGTARVDGIPVRGENQSRVLWAGFFTLLRLFDLGHMTSNG